MKRLGVILILLLAFCGMADSLYVARSESSGVPLNCNIQNLSGCNIVAASHYSRLFGIPVADYGILFYALVFVLAALELALFDQLLRRLLQLVSAVGIVASLYYTAVQLFVIKASCVYCLASAAIALVVFILATALEPLRPSRPAAHSGEELRHFSMPPRH